MLNINRIIVRNRLIYALLLVVVIVLGLCSRKFSKNLPFFIATYSGDILWALMVFCWIGILRPKWTILHVGLISLCFSYFIEITQLYQSPWINSLRQNKLGGLILGRGFLWSDIICYTLGVAIGMVGEIFYYSTKSYLKNSQRFNNGNTNSSDDGS